VNQFTNFDPHYFNAHKPPGTMRVSVPIFDSVKPED
jgi:hypothetical protein